MTAERHASFFDRLSILILSIEWTVFGSMHFALHDLTVQQIPSYFYFRDALVVISGMLEVATGILILVPQARRRAAILSLVLLFLLLPAMFNILSGSGAPGDSTIFQMIFRLVLMPNNIFLAICSVYLLQHPGASLAASLSGAPTRARKRPPPPGPGFATLIVAFLLLMANCAGFLAVVSGTPGHGAEGLLWGMMCIAAGAVMGFLFGVPKINPDTRSGAYLLQNTNIEAVSDWITKILIGIGLINFKEIGGFVIRLSDGLATTLQVPAPFALSITVYFFVVGLIQGYLLTRLFLYWQFLLQVQNAASDSSA